MLQRASIAALAWFVVACTDAEPETGIADQGLSGSTCSCEAPTPTRWVPERSSTAILFPASVDHLETFLTGADGGFYAWGISNGEVLWLYSVDAAYTSDFFSSLAIAWVETETAPGKSHGIAGTLKGPPPPPPTPPGEPIFSPAYVQRVLASAQQHQDATELALGKLGDL